MRIFQFILSVVTTVCGCLFLMCDCPRVAGRDERLVEVAVGVIFISAGISLFVLARRRYQGGWLTLIGTGALVFTLLCVSGQAAEHLIDTLQAKYGVPTMLASGLSAFVLLLLGHWRHRARTRFSGRPIPRLDWLQ
jgi:hypothetical protein